LLEKESHSISPLALAGFTLMVVEMVTNQASKWTNSRSSRIPLTKDALTKDREAHISDLKNVLSKRVRPWRCAFTKLEQAYIMWVVRSTTDAFTSKRPDEINSFKQEIRSRLQAPASWDTGLQGLQDVFIQVYPTKAPNKIYQWDDDDYMFWASRGDLFCNEDLKCLEGEDSVDAATWNRVKNNKRGPCRAGNWWVLCPLAKNSPFASVIPAFGYCLWELDYQDKPNHDTPDGRGYLEVPRVKGSKDLKNCREEEKEWFARLKNGIGEDCSTTSP